MPEYTNKVFIGHGRSPAWRELKDFLHDRLKLDWVEFNREAVAGLTTQEVLSDMLDTASFALLVMTAEDEHLDGRRHARANVIHEVGLFQGRLGFRQAIILLEQECEEFSNIIGLSQIRFPPGNIRACFEDVRGVLEREGMLSGNAKRRKEKNSNDGMVAAGELSSVQIRYLMTISRPRNQLGIPTSFFDQWPDREQETYREMVEAFVDRGLLRVGNGVFLMTGEGYKLSDHWWQLYVLNAVQKSQEGEIDYVPIGSVAKFVQLTDDDQEAGRLQAYLAAR